MTTAGSRAPSEEPPWMHPEVQPSAAGPMPPSDEDTQRIDLATGLSEPPPGARSSQRVPRITPQRLPDPNRPLLPRPRQAEFLRQALSVTFPFVVVLLGTYFAFPGTHPRPAEFVGDSVAAAAVGAAWLLSRTRFYVWGAGLCVAAMVLGGQLNALLLPDARSVGIIMVFTVAGIFLAALVYRPAITISLSAINVAIAVTVLAVRSDVGINASMGAASALIFLSAVVVIVSVLGQRALAEQAQASERLVDSEERYALAARGANDGLWDWDLKGGTAYFSPRWAAMLGLREEELGRALSSWLTRVHPQDAERLRTDLADHVAALTPHFENVHRVRHRDGSWPWMRARGLAVRDPGGKAIRIAGSLTDISEQKQFEEQLLHDAFHDMLTGLPNRALFLNRLAHSIARARRRSTYVFAVLFLDLDRFKVVNDSLGHQLGDDLLIQMSRRLECCIRPGDTVARLGGDEFSILLEDLDQPEDAELVATRIQEALAPPFQVGGHEITSSASIGIALSTHGHNRPEDLIRDADTAMYKAKADGKARHQLFDRRMHEHAVARLKMEGELRRAVEREEFVLHYQPIVALQSGRIEGFEALVRWNHPARGLVYPGEFISVTEETGLIQPLGWWVLRTACEQVRKWQQRFGGTPPLQMNVNLSGRQFRQTDLVRGISTVLQETGLDPQSLRLEITETVVMESAASSREVLAGLHELGIRLCIDDFGNGYSSLNYLHSFDIDVLKIDRSFVSRIEHGRRPEIVQTIVDLSRSLGMAVTAEGVETGEQLRQLRELDCEMAQGFFFSRGLPPEEIESLLERTPEW